ncbi:MAG: hypothetical protein JSR96_03600 [Proteobacteria bacterium]|nr:hypothetical protein [Pseudomonadota bacterium]
MTELIDYRCDEHLAERILQLRCETNDALCGLYSFVKIYGHTFRNEQRRLDFCYAVDSVRDLFLQAITRWAEKARFYNSAERVEWARAIETTLARHTLEMRRQLDGEQIVLGVTLVEPPQKKTPRCRS